MSEKNVPEAPLLAWMGKRGDGLSSGRSAVTQLAMLASHLGVLV